jgi:uncharacterized membrane protein
MSTNRMEAFSDGVFAVAITLLVLDIAVPDPTHTAGGLHLARALLAADQWPHYVAYAVSFLTIGIIWINHHVMIRRLRATDQAILTLNLLLLLTVVALPFTTSLVATYLRQPHGRGVAAGVWAGSFLAMSLAFAALHRHILLGKPRLLAREISPQESRRILARNNAGLIPYAVATAVAAVSAYASVGICAAIAVFYALPFATSADS